MIKRLIIIGASGFGREVAWLTERINKCGKEWEILGFIDDDLSLNGKNINGYKILATTSDIAKFKDCYFVCAVGASKIRENIIKKVRSINPDTKFATLIDPSAEISAFVKIGEGTIICAGNIITTNIDIGKHVILNLKCTVGHDAILKDFTTVYPSVNISGKTDLGYACEVGTGTQIIQGKKIGDYSVVGAGAVVVKDIPNNCTAVGVPAKPIKFQEAH